jgi:hypothetical protein
MSTSTSSLGDDWLNRHFYRLALQWRQRARDEMIHGQHYDNFMNDRYLETYLRMKWGEYSQQIQKK